MQRAIVTVMHRQGHAGPTATASGQQCAQPDDQPAWLDELATADDDTPLLALRTTSDPCVTSADVTVAIIRDLFFESDESGTILVLNNTNRDEAKQRLATLTFVEE